MTKPIIFTYLLLPASRHVILNGLSDPWAGSELLGEYGFTDEAVTGNSLHSAAGAFGFISHVAYRIIMAGIYKIHNFWDIK